MENSPENVNAARQTIRQLLPYVESAERKFKSARNWGILDILGGGLITDLIKHSKINSASSDMNEVQHLMEILQTQLSSLTVNTDYRMRLGGFSTFADFVFDGAIFDIYMESKIMSSLEQVRQLKQRLKTMDDMLSRM